MNDIDNELRAFLQNVGDNCDVDRYLNLYNEVKESGVEGCEFVGNDHHYADHLFQWGFLQILMTPIRNKDGVLRGHKTVFYSLVEPKDIAERRGVKS